MDLRSEAVGAPAGPSRAQILCVHCGEPVEALREPAAARPAQARLRGLRCPAGHRFDAAKQGYVNLLVGRGSRFTPDTTEMVLARERVQTSGAFDVLSTALRTLAAEAVGPLGHPVILDCGAGTGHYLSPLLDDHPTATAIAVDLSAAGLRRAARLPRTTALVWDLWRDLPVADAGVDLLLNIFAPRHPAEYARVLSQTGTAVIVTPGPRHLQELAEYGLLQIPEDKADSAAETMSPHLRSLEAPRTLSAEVQVSPATAADVVLMGPAGHHRSRQDVESRLTHLFDPDHTSASKDAPAPPALTLTIDLRLSRFTR